ncbi:hypothetical protein [Nocardioides iriomotensis]|uniref:Uncharacterized protein n=1 Tax=Nocardioides iriomotensis TaxID=715784 RepID=A0A4Q5J2T0_9ACTN|nr:hypothetical protein [Nocardioides iriomotensis]RYU12734.1 hypothetical protein ETU37_07090 [Nocardioides iriomotensis]
MVDRTDDGDDDETFREWNQRRLRGFLTSAAAFLILFGIFALVAPWLPARSPEQEDANPWLWTGVGLVLVAVGSFWLYKRVKRDGFHPIS